MRVLTSLFGCLLIMQTAAWADDLLTMDQLKQLETDKNWTELIKATTRNLALRGKAAEGYDRVQLWKWKAEAQVQMKLSDPASSTFEKLSEEKDLAQDVVDQAQAMSRVMKRTDARGFRLPATKEQPAQPPIDVTVVENRAEAIKALFGYEYAEVARDFAAAQKKGDLSDLVKIAKDAKSIPQLERAANKTEEKSRQLITDLSALMASTIGKWEKDSSETVRMIKASANETYRVPGKPRRDGDRAPDVIKKRGITPKDRTDLTDIIKESERVAATFKRFTEQAGEPTGDLAEIPRKVEGLYKEAQGVLNDDYSSVFK